MSPSKTRPAAMAVAILQDASRLGLVLTVIWLASACGGGGGERGERTAPRTEEATTAPTPLVGTITLTKPECTLEGVSGPISPGAGAFAVVNHTDGYADFEMGKIAEGHTYEELQKYVAKARKVAEAGGPVVHRPSYLGGGGSARLRAGESGILIATALVPGTYGVVCLRAFPKVGMRPSGLAGPVQVE